MDGTRFCGNASRSRSRSYDRLTENELEYAQRVAELLAEAAEIGEAEDAAEKAGQLREELLKALSTAAQ